MHYVCVCIPKDFSINTIKFSFYVGAAGSLLFYYLLFLLFVKVSLFLTIFLHKFKESRTMEEVAMNSVYCFFSSFELANA